MTLEIYLTNLGKYNEGVLKGKWVDCLSSPNWEEELEEIGVAEGSDYEEFFITDVNTDIDGIEIGEYESLDSIDKLADLINNYGEDEAFGALMDLYDGDADVVTEAFERGGYSFYAGVTDHEELGEYLVEEGIRCSNADEDIKIYLDYEKIGRDYDYNSSGGFYGNGFLEVY